MTTTYKKAKIWQLILFSGNETATTAGFNLVSLFFLVMITDSLFLSGIGAGVILFLSRVIDAFTDPIIGTMIDNTLTKFGKFRPYIVAGSILINIGLFFMFSGFITFESQALMYIWLFFWYIIYIFGYTFQSSVTRSAQTQLNNDPKQRALLGAMMAVLSYMFYGLFLIFSIDYIESFPGGTQNPTGYLNLVLFIISVNVVLTIGALIGLWESDQIDKYENYKHIHERVSVMTIKNILVSNRPLIALIIAAGTNKLAQVLTATAMIYFFKYTVQNVGLQQTMAIYGMILAAIGLAAGTYIAATKSRKKSFLLGTYLGILFPAIIIIMHPFDQSMHWILVWLLAGIVAANALATVNVLPMIAEVTDYELYKNKRYVPGLVGATFSLIDKLMSSLSGIILAIALFAISYESDMTPTNEAFWAFYILIIIIPVLGHIASIMAFKHYPINKQFYEEMIASIHEEIHQ